MSNPAELSMRSSNSEGGPAAESPLPEDAKILEQVQDGDPTAMAVLYQRYSRLVYSVAMRVLRDTAASEDVLQEIFLQMWRNPERFAPSRGSLGGWLAVVARNRSIDVLRRRRPTEVVEEMSLPATGNLADEAEQNNMMERARAAIHLLPTEQRKTLEMAFYEGLTHAEIAEKTGDPLGTVKTRIRTGLLSVRKAFQA
jgi:RNA polymerase sigma-70 factor (ECF subfamily)